MLSFDRGEVLLAMVSMLLVLTRADVMVLGRRTAVDVSMNVGLVLQRRYSCCRWCSIVEMRVLNIFPHWRVLLIIMRARSFSRWVRCVRPGSIEKRSTLGPASMQRVKLWVQCCLLVAELLLRAVGC